VAPESLTGHLRARAWACRAQGLPSETATDLISDKPNRWNVEGEPTIYVSGDPALALVESGRHPDDVGGESALIEVELAVARTVDLRDPRVRHALDLPDEGTWVLDRARTRAVAQSLRHSRMCDALMVPSAGALDQPDRWNAVVFADDRRSVTRMVGRPARVGAVMISRQPHANRSRRPRGGDARIPSG
jgi:RES domain-containing protein